MTVDYPPADREPTLPGSYPTFWDAIPVDPPAEPERRRSPRPAAAEDAGPVYLAVTQADVG